MALDRQSIERRDFPIGRRGYDPEAVDAHLARLAEEVDSLRDAGSGGPSPRTPDSIAAIAGQQVAAIVQAAETTAGAIERAARDEADTVRRRAESEAAAAREDAVDRARAHVGKVADAATAILQRIDAMDQEVSTLTEALRTGATRLQADLELLAGNMEDLHAAGTPAAAAALAPSPPPRAPAPTPVAVEETLPEPAPEPPVRGAEEEIAPVATPVATAEEDVEGARLIALNMALNGTSREETDRYLAENFDLADRRGLLDEVYASVEG